jgi:predicted metal-dependent peptidase
MVNAPQSLKHTPVAKPAAYTPEQAATVRAKYGTALSYITMRDPNAVRNGQKYEKPAHQFYLSYSASLRYRETSSTPWACVAYHPGSPIGEIHFNPRNCELIDLAPFCGLVVHELLHVMCGHAFIDSSFRRKHPKILSIAVDMVVDELTLKDGYDPALGKGVLADDPDFEHEALLCANVAKMLQVPTPPVGESTEYYCLWLLEILKKAQEKQDQKQPCPDCGGSGQKTSDSGAAGGRGKPEAPPQDGDGNEPDGENGDGGDQPDDEATYQPGNGPGDEVDGDNGNSDSGAAGGREPGGQSGHGGGTESCDCPTCQGQGELGTGDWAQAVIDQLASQTGHEGSLMEMVEGLDDESRDIVMRNIAENVKEAVANSGGMGALPGHLQMLATHMLKCLEPKLTLEHLVSEFYGGCGTAVPYSRRHRMRRTSPLPGLMGQRPGMSAGAVVDSSGSNSDKEFCYAFGILKKVAEQQDMEVHVQQSSYGPTEEIISISDAIIGGNVNRTGYGGTNMRPGIMGFIEQTEEEEEYAVGGILVLTDSELGLDSLVTPEETDIPILWLNSRRHNPFKGHRFAGRMFFYDPETGLLDELFS